MKKHRHLAVLLIATLCLRTVVLAESTPRLLPFQARLVDGSGKALPDGTRLLRFRISTSPTEDTFVRAGEMHRAMVNGGLVNVVLGTKANLASLDFNQALYLEITVDDGDEKFTDLDKPLSPRQSLVPPVFSVESAKLAGYDWTELFGINSPQGPLLANKIPAGSVDGSKLANGAVTLDKLQPGLLPIITAWREIQITPLLDATVAAKSRRVGENVEISAEFFLNRDLHTQVANDGGVGFDIPYSIAFDKFPSSRRQIVGTWFARSESGATASGACIVGSDAVGGNRLAAVVHNPSLPNSFRFDSKMELSLRVSTPVVGWGVGE